MDWQLGTSLAGNVIALGGLLWRLWTERAASVTVRQRDFSPYPRFQAEAGQEPNIANRHYLELELSNTSRKHALERYEFLVDFGANASIEQAEAVSKSSLRPVEVLQETLSSRRYRVNNFDPGDIVIFKFRLSNLTAHQCSVDGYGAGVKFRKVQLKKGVRLN